MNPVPSVEEIRRRLDLIRTRISEAALRSGHSAGEVSLLAVTKGQPVELVRRAAEAGLALFGENRVAEGAKKIEVLRDELPNLTWKLIGPLQTNKAGQALKYFAEVESVDRERLVDRLGRLLEATDKLLPVLLEFNLAGEPSKSGAPPERARELARAALECPHLQVRGVMAIPPFDPDPERSRPYFRRLREIRDFLQEEFRHPFPELSMGMSHDFAVAVEEGSTEVRIGTALFGPRDEA